MFNITKYKNVKSPDVLCVLSIEDFFESVKNGDLCLKHIEYARSFEKSSDDYDSIKTNLIPTYRFNFLFDKKASNRNIVNPTGLIFLDVDNVHSIPDNDFIYAKWKSVSLTGFGILVKVDNLSVENFSDSYADISELLEIYSDSGAMKPTQQTVQSYDPDIYINKYSKIYNCIASKKVPIPSNKEREEECLARNDTFSKNHEILKVRFNNINDYFIDNDSPYIVFKEKKENLCIPFVPFTVAKGIRNKTMFTYLSQIVALNPLINKSYIKAVAESINDNAFKPKLPIDEVSRIIESIFRLKESNELHIFYNKARRMIFNPNLKLGHKEKIVIVNKEMGKLTTAITELKIYECLEGWDFEKRGIITQKKVAQVILVHESTIKRHWFKYKEFIHELNEDFRETFKGIKVYRSERRNKNEIRILWCDNITYEKCA